MIEQDFKTRGLLRKIESHTPSRFARFPANEAQSPFRFFQDFNREQGEIKT